ncbi:Zinc finger and BTB domain-containing protein 7A [Mizuhopecten yessoensis]|uniref:Zinc finger and BTB domain-containing protein 7A n=2 Tax=Mizuhopecten yessoensis TaxID=6573 RepID=A0A210Q3H9_MIZYE|nr:Zinc finger and BTB domain-containing protein 7A [Mizuhopecten yessoensis]
MNLHKHEHHKTHYRGHISSFHKHSAYIQTKLTCEDCGKIFETMSGKNRHVLRCHSNATCKICQICNKRCENQSSLRVHLARHSDERPYKCSVCGQTYKHQHQLNRHRNVSKKCQTLTNLN